MRKNSPNVVYLTNTTAPYRERMHELIARQLPTYSVIYCTKLEPDRLWDLEFGDYDKYFLSEASAHFNHNNPEVWALLNKLDPSAVIITGFKPTMLYGALWCLLKRRELIVYNDGTYKSEMGFSFLQKFFRKLVFAKANAFVTPCDGGFDLYKSYHLDESKMYRSCLCIDNSRFTPGPVAEREYHILFCGQIIERKMPLFFVEIAKKLQQKIPDLKVLIVGEGAMRNQMLQELENNGIHHHFAGYLSQKDLPSYYEKSKLFLFPTLNDPWGVVANEACAAGTPVIVSDNAGAAHDLIIHGKNGFVLDHDADVWAEHCLKLLTDNRLLQTFSDNAVRLVQPYNHRNAADGIIQSVYSTLQYSPEVPVA